MDNIMGIVLRSGVLIAALTVLAGAVVLFVRDRVPPRNYRVFAGEPVELHTIRGIVHEALAFHGSGMIQLGLLLLIATPVARVLFSVFAFAYQKDWKYVAFTLVVLGLLMFSFLGG